MIIPTSGKQPKELGGKRESKDPVGIMDLEFIQDMEKLGIWEICCLLC